MRLPTRTEPPAPAEPEAFPPYAYKSLQDWLAPFFANHGLVPANFLKEVERNLRFTLDWSGGAQTALKSIDRRANAEPAFFVQLVDFAAHRMLIGYDWPDVANAARALDRILYETGAAWRVQTVDANKAVFCLERRSDPAVGPALAATVSGGGPEADHLSKAWQAAYGQHPNASDAYKNAVKAVEDVSIRVVLPSDASATLGKVIGELRGGATKWEFALARPVGPPNKQRESVEVVIDMLDLLWRNQTDRHGSGRAPVPITQPQAEVAVNLALALVPIFRDGAITKRDMNARNDQKEGACPTLR